MRGVRIPIAPPVLPIGHRAYQRFKRNFRSKLYEGKVGLFEVLRHWWTVRQIVKRPARPVAPSVLLYTQEAGCRTRINTSARGRTSRRRQATE